MTGAIHNFFFGKHWRELWGTPIKVEVLDLDKFAGGLTPLKRGGGATNQIIKISGEGWELLEI